jgi:hypothetical protein
MSKHPNLFKTLQTKPIAQVRVSATDVEEFTGRGAATTCVEKFMTYRVA